MRNLDNKLLRDGLEQLRSRLPAGWEAGLAREGQRGPEGGAADGCYRVVSPDRKRGLLAVETRRRLEPRGVIELASRWEPSPGEEERMLVAPYLSPAVRERLREAAICFLDLTGNARIELARPGLFIETQGADVDPDPRSRPARSLRGAKAGRIVRALIDSRELPGVRELAERTGTDPGYVSRVFSFLDREALIGRSPSGSVSRPESGPKSASVSGSRTGPKSASVSRTRRDSLSRVDWPRLLRRWAEEAPLDSRGTQGSYLEPRGIEALRSNLKKLSVRYAVTGALAAERLAPAAPPRLAVVYVEDMDRAAAELGLRAVDSGANVLLIEPGDEGVFAGAVLVDGLRFVAPSQAAADLLTSPGRGPAEAEELIDWMEKNEDVWRG